MAACVPELAADWAVNAADLDLPTVALGHLASRVVQITEARPAVDLAPLFAEVEVRLSNGDATTRDILITGFLESLQNVDPGRADRWRPFSGRSTLAARIALNDMWAGRMNPGDWNDFVRGGHVTLPDPD